MEKRGIIFIVIKRKKMIKSKEEAECYRYLPIETSFSIVGNSGLRFITPE